MKRLLILVPLLAASLLTSCDDTVVGISSGYNGHSESVNDAYAYSVSKAGGVPVILPLVRSAVEADDVVALIDALIMSGGEDVDPARYGEDVWNETVYVNGARDTSDFLLLEAASRKGIPILGICRGEQILNVHLGGSLYQDIPSQIDTAVAHNQSASYGTATQIVYIDRDSRLYELLGKDSVMVNTFHHQAVKTPGKGVKITARSANGVVEAYEGGKYMGVQFHPEGLVEGGDDSFLPIFKELIRMAR